MQARTTDLPQLGTKPMLTVLTRSFAASFALVFAACGGAPDRPPTQDVAGRTDHIVADPATPSPGTAAVAAETSEPCEHGTVVECKVWLTDVDCYSGLAVCDSGQLSGCMDADAAEAALAGLTASLE